MKTKSTNDNIQALKQVAAKQKPRVIMSDNDAAFTSREFQKELQTLDIIHDMNLVGDHNALGVIDRFAKNLKVTLYKYFKRSGKCCK
jgi:transposase InsO family protein